MLPETAGFHFSQPLWLVLLLVPVGVGWLLAGTGSREWLARYQGYAQPHLLPHLLVEPRRAGDRPWRRWGLWALLWILATLAMAGPRWDFVEVEVFAPAADLVVLLDLSRSMDVVDSKPSRLARAHQEIADLIAAKPSVRMGLVVFATVAHVITPLTEDLATLERVLPALATHRMSLSGSRLSAGLERAHTLLNGNPHGGAKSILLVSDGDFAEPEALDRVRELRAQGIRLYTLGVGSVQGGSVPDTTKPAPEHGRRGGGLSPPDNPEYGRNYGGVSAEVVRDRQGQPVISRLDEVQLQALAQAGGGVYVRADYRSNDSSTLLAQIRRDAPATAQASSPQRIWAERFDVPLGLMMVILLWWFRRGNTELFP